MLVCWYRWAGIILPPPPPPPSSSSSSAPPHGCNRGVRSHLAAVWGEEGNGDPCTETVLDFFTRLTSGPRGPIVKSLPLPQHATAVMRARDRSKGPKGVRRCPQKQCFSRRPSPRAPASSPSPSHGHPLPSTEGTNVRHTIPLPPNVDYLNKAVPSGRPGAPGEATSRHATPRHATRGGGRGRGQGQLGLR